MSTAVNNKRKAHDPSYKYTDITKLPNYARHDYDAALQAVSNTPSV